MPTMYYLIVALGVAWLVIRYVSSKAEARRREAREQRMEELMAQREALLGHAAAPEAAVVQAPTPSPAATNGPRTCLGCRTVNEPDAVTCKGCGLEL